MIDTGLKDRVALVTGGNNPMGIGAATARAFAREGAKVFITYLRTLPERRDIPIDEIKKATEPGYPLYYAMHMKSADEVLGVIREAGGQAAAWEADLTCAENIPLLFDRAESEFGPVEVLVNNAAYATGPDTTGALTAEIIDQTYAVNTRATLLLIDEFVRRYKKNKRKWGRIINLSTGPAQYFNGQITYGTSKAAIEAATRAIASEIGPLGITVNTVAPGGTQTGYIDKEGEKKWRPTCPMRRIGQPEDIANAILFLASNQASWVTGQVIRVTGGADM